MIVVIGQPIRAATVRERSFFRYLTVAALMYGSAAYVKWRVHVSAKEGQNRQPGSCGIA